MKVTLTTKPRKKSFIPIEAETITPRNFLTGMDHLTVFEGNKERRLDDLFYITVDGPAVSPESVEVILRGDTGRIKRVGEYMNAGKISIEGDIGMHCGNFMNGGEITIGGNADAWLGREMRGGRILCKGNAGHYCGSGYRGEKRGMRGGRIEVMGNTGDFCAEFLSGGEVYIHGETGDMPGAEMHGGVLVIEGNCSRPCGNMKDGTCYIFGDVSDLLPTFRYERTETEQKQGILMDVFRGDVANRGKGKLCIRRQ